MVAAERLGELRRLAVADGPRDLATGSVPGCSSSAACAMRTRWSSRRKLVPCSAKHALELAAGGGDRVRDGGQREVLVAEVARDRGQSLLEKGSPSVLGGLPHHRGYTCENANRMPELCCRLD